MYSFELYNFVLTVKRIFRQNSFKFMSNLKKVSLHVYKIKNNTIKYFIFSRFLMGLDGDLYTIRQEIVWRFRALKIKNSSLRHKVGQKWARSEKIKYLIVLFWIFLKIQNNTLNTLLQKPFSITKHAKSVFCIGFRLKK